MSAVRTPGGIGVAMLRKEDAELIVGKGRFVDDIQLPGLLHLVFVRSPHAHADISSIDIAAALAVPGVVAAFTADDLVFQAGVPCGSDPTGDAKKPERMPLSSGRVRMVGEPVAVVVAESRYAAADGAAAVVVDYDILPAVTDAEQASLPGAPQLHEIAPGNLCCTLAAETPGFDEAVAGAAVVVRQRIVNQRLTAVPMETRGVVAQVNPANDEVTLTTSTQAPHFVKTFVAIVCGISEAKIRVIAPDVGGGFGVKIASYAEEFIAVAVSRKLGGAAVKWTETRAENMVATSHGRDQIQDVELYATADGKLLGLRVHIYANMGAYLQLLSPSIPGLTLGMITGTYVIPNLSCTVDNVFTNTTPTDAYRGAGRPEAAHLIERAMDILARRVGLEPAEVRRRNFIGEFPYTTLTGMVYDSGDYAATLDEALRLWALDTSAVAAREQALAAGKRVGTGLCSWVEVCGIGPSAVMKASGISAPGWESATVRLHPTGKATVITGTSPHGQGHATSWSQIIESRLGIPFDDVEVIHGDTAFAPYGLGTYGSRSLAVGGTAVWNAAERIKEKARKISAHLLEAAPDDVDFEEGRFFVKGSPERGVTIQEAAYAGWIAHDMPEGVEPGFDETTFFDPPNMTFPFGSHLCEVAVDPETGKVEILRYLAVDDCGNVVNPMIVDGQVHGGVAQGIAQALFEETVFDDAGQPLMVGLVDYMIPSAAELPHIQTARTVTPTLVNPLGAKGVGEAGTIAASAVVVNAVCNALDLDHLDMPLQPARVWAALNGGAR